MGKTLDLPPFPPLTWRESLGSGEWGGSLILPAWAGFQPGQGPRVPRTAPMPSDGRVVLSVDSPDRVGAPPAAAQAAAYRHLVEHQAETRDAILQVLFDGYPAEQEACGWKGEDADEIMPDLQAPEQLRTLIGLSTVYVLAVSKNGVAYVGFEFRCLWEVEHGIGVMTHRRRVIEVGQAEEAFSSWSAERDAEQKR